MEFYNSVLDEIVGGAILLFESIGVFVLMYNGLKGFFFYIKGNPNTRLILAKGMAMGLEFKLGSEILRTVVVREWAELGVVAGIILLRAALTFLLHWEIRQEENSKRIK